MTTPLDKLLTTFRRGFEEPDVIRRVFVHCEEQHVRAELLREGCDSAKQQPMATEIIGVREGEFLIHPPTIDATEQSLRENEQLTLTVARPVGRMTGRCVVRGECREQRGGTQQMCAAYRLALPERLDVVNDRKYFRLAMSGAEQVEVVLRGTKGEGAVHGQLRDVSVGGAQIAVRPGEKVMQGSTLQLIAQLPEPAGLLSEKVRVVRISRSQRSEELIVGVEFAEEVEMLERFIRQKEIQRAQRERRVDA